MARWTCSCGAIFEANPTKSSTICPECGADEDDIFDDAEDDQEFEDLTEAEDHTANPSRLGKIVEEYNTEDDDGSLVR